MRELVIPGDLLDESGAKRPGLNTYREGAKIYATRLGVKDIRGDRVSVIQLSGRYEAQRGDLVIGTIVELGPSNWYIGVGAAQDVGLHVNDVPWRVEFGETSKYLAVGDTALLKIAMVDETKKVVGSMKDRQCRKLTGGLVVEVSPSKVPRIIGRGGSMIAMIKEMTGTRMFVGQNGRIWVDGEPKDVALAIDAIHKVEEEAHTSGLTDKVKQMLETARGRTYEEVRAEARKNESEWHSNEGQGEGMGEREAPRDDDSQSHMDG
ncbi:MAG: exosome complex RNA-binding protein Rrp4 [Thermoplasmatota archaeon]